MWEPLTDNYTFENLLAMDPAKQMAAGVRPPFSDRASQHVEALVKRMTENPPDLMIADFTSYAGMVAARHLGIPYIVNFPGPLSMFNNFQAISDNKVLSGVLKTVSTTMSVLLEEFDNILPWFGNSIVVVNSFWGIDPPMKLMPNLNIVGPVQPASSTEPITVEEFADVELKAWLQKAAGKTLIYITMGSLAELSEKQVRALFDGTKELGSWVIWSLKDGVRQKYDFLSPEKLPENYVIKSWMPQADILRLPALKVVVMHCGWGGTLECILAAKPVLTHPFFGDQPDNAKLLKQCGMGEGLDTNSYTKKDVVRELGKLLAPDAKYEQVAMLLQKKAMAAPGVSKVVEIAEYVAIHKEIISTSTSKGTDIETK